MARGCDESVIARRAKPDEAIPERRQQQFLLGDCFVRKSTLLATTEAKREHERNRVAETAP
jgi:hypothetical protein